MNAPDKVSSLEETNIAGPEIVAVAQRIAIEERALDVRGLDIRKLTDVTDYLVISSGTSSRHTANIAEKIKVELKSKGEAPVRVSSKGAPDWIILDYGDVVVHVFYEATRQYYQLDQLWSEAKLVGIPSDLEAVASRLKTGLFSPSALSGREAGE